MNIEINILHVENDTSWLEIVRAVVPRNHRLRSVETLPKARIALDKEKYDLLIVDLGLSDNTTRNDAPFRDLTLLMNDLRVQQNDLALSLRTKVVILTGRYPSTDEILEAIRLNRGWIWGWLYKDSFNRDDLLVLIQDAEKYKRIAAERSEAWPRSPVWVLATGAFASFATCVVSIVLVNIRFGNFVYALLTVLISTIVMMLVALILLRALNLIDEKTFRGLFREPLSTVQQVFAEIAKRGPLL